MKKPALPFLTALGIVALVAMSCSSPVSLKAFSTPTLSATATQTLPPTETSAPTLTPTPTPPPAARVDIAESAIFMGDFEEARREFQNAQSAPEPEIQSAAALGIGRSLYLQGNYSTAIDTLEDMVAAYPDGPHTANAYYFLAQSYAEQKIYERAADAYNKFLQLRPGVLDAHVQGLRGDMLMAAGNAVGAIEAYQAAVQAPQLGSTIWIELSLGNAYAASGDFANAIKTYLEVYEKTDNTYAKAQANLLMGQTYLNMGMPEQANTRFLDSVYNYPKAYDSYSGLIQLVNNGVEVSELNRGLVDYYAGQYGLAVEAFNRYIENTVDVDATAFYYRGLSRVNMNEPLKALEDFNYIIENFRGDPLWASAWDEKAYTLWAYLDDYEQAAQTLLAYVEEAPESARAPELLYQAARIQERNQQLVEAAATWERLIDTYPSGEQSFRGLFLAGVSYYRAGDFPKALAVFQRYLVLANTTEEQSAAYLWIGKTHQAQGDNGAARTAWEQGAQLDPTGYYSERANELLQNRTPFTLNNPVDLGYDLAQERVQAEEWLRTTFQLAPETNLAGLGDLGGDPRIQRGAAFWELGLYEEARDEFEALREEVSNSAEQSYRLMNYVYELGAYRSAVLASRQILDLAGLDDVGTLRAPAYFNHIRFGVYYKEQIMEASQTEEFHPLLLLSVLRQESMFEGYAISSAGARGLMQIMPATGQEIASSMGLSHEYTDGDLYRPEMNIAMGSRYLSRQRDYFGGSAFAMLAAYNGGPGNTMIWKEMAGDDPDLLLEVIRADETRQYIMNIFEYFNIYRLIYERGL